MYIVWDRRLLNNLKSSAAEFKAFHEAKLGLLFELLVVGEW